jgi:hypothetical protein
MRQRKKELTICSNPSCGIEFLKDKSEIIRNKKINRKNYCSRKCCGIDNHTHLKQYVNENIKYLEPQRNNRRDQFTGLREHFRRLKKRHHEYNIDLQDLLDQWEIQSGICVYSGVKLVQPNENGNNINTASLDRINSNLGYVKGNIQFISTACNHAKNSMTHDEMLNFIDLIYQSVKTKKGIDSHRP